MWGKAYKVHRHTGRMTMDSSQRMTWRAESGLGMGTLLGLLIIVGAIVWMVSNG